MASLYCKCFEVENIREAIKVVMSHEGSKTSGPDGINKDSKISEERIIKEVKLRLRKYVKVNSRKVEIPKKDGSKRELTIINLYDRIAQQAVYQVIINIVEIKMSKHSYGFRPGINTKVAVSKIANHVCNKQEIYTVEIDFKKCFDNIPLDSALDMLRELGVRDGRLLSTIKHLMYTSREYSGVGISQGTILGPLLCNCYLTKLDRFMEETFRLDEREGDYARLYRRNKGEWIKWNLEHRGKVRGSYFRYADDSIIVCCNKEEQEYIKEQVTEFIRNNLEIEINEAKTKYRKNEFDFLGFHLKKSKERNGAVWIRISEPERYLKKLDEFRFNTVEDTLRFVKWYRGIMYYYDIVNDMGYLIDRIQDRMYFRSTKKTSIIRRTEDHKYELLEKDRKIEIDLYEIRKYSKVSFKDYLVKSIWLTRRELIKEKVWDNSYNLFHLALWTKQKGKNPVTGKDLYIGDLVIHHINPRKKQGSNGLSNLMLIDKKTHDLIHGTGKCNAKIERLRKHLR